MVSTNDMRPGQSIILDSQIYNILEYQHVKPGKGKAFVKTKLKNITSGGVVDKTFRADEAIDILMPTTINLEVTKSEPAVKGDSVNSNTREVTCETGLTLQVPMFVNEKDIIKIDTKTKSYITRV